MTVVDPFAGVALGALDAMWKGLNWVGCELEPKFVKLGQANIDLWRRKYGSKEGFGTAQIIQGDSRKLTEVIAGADCCIGSPPFADAMSSKDIQFMQKHADDTGRDFSKPGGQSLIGNFVSTPGQLGAMKEGDFDCVVGSPPYAGNRFDGGEESLKHKQGFSRGYSPDGGYADNTPGQLASLPEGRFEAVISSPPYEGSEGSPSGGRLTALSGGTMSSKAQVDLGMTAKYGESKGQLGHTIGDTFWSAARDILVQCHAILRPGGHAIWVTKRFVRAGKIVAFSDQWQALCESVGFRLVCRHRAMLVKNHGEQETIWDGTKELKTERKSFFRKLCEKKGSPRIDWEDVICLIK